MSEVSARGSQKQARLDRLKREIIAYVAQYPGCSAADIVCHLSNIPKVGDFFTFEIFNERIFVIRDEDGIVNAFQNFGVQKVNTFQIVP